MHSTFKHTHARAHWDIAIMCPNFILVEIYFIGHVF